MYSRQVKLNNVSGLHARPAAEFAKTAKRFISVVEIRKEGSIRAVNAKSIAQLLSEAITSGTVVQISAQGPDEREAVDQLVALVESGLGEKDVCV